MEIAPGTRGIVIGDRYRVSGALRRTGMIDAVDLEADRAEAACRIVGVPGDAERVDAWEDAWRAAQEAARLPRLREIVLDDDGVYWAALDASRASGAALPDDARQQARAIGEALAAAGFDVGGITRGMLVADDGGVVCVDGAVWLGGDAVPRAAGRVVMGLLPQHQAPVEGPASASDDGAVWLPPRRRGALRRPRRSRLLLPVAIVALLVAAAVVLLAPARSQGVAIVAPGTASSIDDVILGTSPPPLEVAAPAPPAVADAPRPTEPIAASAVEPARTTAAAESLVPPPATQPSTPAAIPAAAGDDAPEIPLAAPALPVAAGMPELPAAAARSFSITR
jgi:hypothetical protein